MKLTTLSLASVFVLALATTQAAEPSTKLTKPVTKTVEGVPLEVKGATLTALHVNKKVNVELSNGDFLELSVPLFAYTVRPEYKVQASDATTIRTLAARQAKLLALPLPLLIQPENLKALRETPGELSVFAESFVQRMDPFDLPEVSAPKTTKP